jgi:hypothetical protein
VPIEWINSVHYLYDQSRAYTAALAAMQAPLPQQQISRVTFSGSHLNGRSGVGVGWAYMLDDERRSAFTLSVGHSHGETAVQGSFGFEFGGDRRMKISMAEIEPKAAPPEPEPVVVAAAAREAVDEAVQTVVVDHDEDIQQIQMAQNQLSAEVRALAREVNKPRQVERVIQQEPAPQMSIEEKQAVLMLLMGESDYE